MTPVSSGIAIYRKSTGALEYLAPTSMKPTDPAFGWIALPSGFDDQSFAWDSSTHAFIEAVAKIEAQLIDAIKSEAERRKMLVRSPGSGKGAEYRQKRAEAQASATVTAAVLNALTKPATLAQYPAATMEAELTGEKLATVLARYLSRSNAVESEVMRLSAIEQAATIKIRAATTSAGKRAAFGAIDWTWQPA